MSILTSGVKIRDLTKIDISRPVAADTKFVKWKKRTENKHITKKLRIETSKDK
jgi:hypothetical protein